MSVREAIRSLREKPTRGVAVCEAGCVFVEALDTFGKWYYRVIGTDGPSPWRPL